MKNRLQALDKIFSKNRIDIKWLFYQGKRKNFPTAIGKFFSIVKIRRIC